MTIREQMEQREKEILSPYATLSVNTKGRSREEEPCDLRPAFQRDRDRILHCKSFRRLKQKTQVFLCPRGDHYRTRMTHTLEVSQIARTIARALRLNEDLTEAIALGHDLGHTPYGHAGERALNRVCESGFHHNEQSVRVVEVIEKDGQGLNLTWEVLDGILNHQTSRHPATLEGQIVRLSDKIAYIHHDFDDAIRAGILSDEEIPAALRGVLGETTKARLNTLVHDVIMNSIDKPEIGMSSEIAEAMTEIRKFMFANVYVNPIAKSEETKAIQMIENLFYYFEDHIDQMPEEYSVKIRGGEDTQRIVCDYIAGMTDGYSVQKFEEIFVPKAWKKIE